MKKLGIIILCLVCLLTDVFSASYYVSPTGSDIADGLSPATAWQTLSRASTQSFVAGDYLYFEGGQTFNGVLLLTSDDSGTSGNHVIIDSYGTGIATLNGGADTAIDGYNVQGITVRNIKATGNWNSVTQSGNSEAGISFWSDLPGTSTLSGINIDNVESTGFRHGVSIGFWSTDNSKGHIDNINITNSLFHDNARSGLLMWGNSSVVPVAYGYNFRNVLIRNCKSYNNEGETGYAGATGYGFQLDGIQNATIEHCLAYNNGARNGYAPGGPIGIMAYYADNVTIQFCESYNNHTGTSSTDGGGYDLDGAVSNSTIQYCYSHDNDGAGYLVVSWNGATAPTGTNTIRYCISENDCRRNNFGAISVFSGTNDTYVYGNTIYITPAVAGTSRGMYFSGGNRVRAFNNLVMSTGARLVETMPNYTVNYNNYLSSGNIEFRHNSVSYTNFAAFTAASGYEANGKTDRAFTYRNLRYPQMPLVGTIGDAYNLASIRAYRLQPTSPMIDAGFNLASLFPLVNMGTRDFWGNPIPQNGIYDIGAHETAKIIGRCTVSN